MRPQNWKQRIAVGLKAAFPERRMRRLVGTAVDVATQTTLQERICLYEEACWNIRLGRFLEVGSYLGASSVVLAEALRRWGNPDQQQHVYCVDTWENDTMTEGQRSTRDEFMKNTRRWSDIIVPVVGNSRDVSLPFEGECDVVFIDGDHSYAGCQRDVERFAPLVRDGGRLILHDHAYYHGVTTVLGELLAAGQWHVSISVENLISLRKDPHWSHRVPGRMDNYREAAGLPPDSSCWIDRFHAPSVSTLPS